MLPSSKKIICPVCSKETGFTEEGLRYYVLPDEGLKCPHCEYLVVKKPNVTWC